MKNKKNIEDLLVNWYEKTSENIVGAGYSRKIKNGKLTKDVSLTFYVKEKKPLAEVDDSDVIPRTLVTRDGEEFITDVIEVGKSGINFLAQEFQCLSYHDANPPENRGLYRPLRGGVSLTNFSDLNSYVGTLGFLGIDSLTGAVVGVTNSHIVVKDAFNTSERSPFSSEKSSTLNDYVVQPHPLEIGKSASDAPDYKIGFVKRYYPLSTADYNQIDAGLITIDDPSLLDDESFKIAGLNYNSPMNFATTEEIDSVISLDLDCYTSGRSSGPRGEGLQKLKVASLSASSSVNYVKQGATTLAYFNNCLVLVGIDENGNILNCTVNSGDSGSVVIADFGGERKIIGIMFAGGNSHALACRIDEIAEKLKIRAWDGRLENLKYSKSYSKKYLNNATTDLSINYPEEGKIYWQAGLVNASEVIDQTVSVYFDPASNKFIMNNLTNGQPITLEEGKTYQFDVNSPGHPLLIEKKLNT